MRSEKYPRIDPDLIKILEELYKPLEYDADCEESKFARRSAFRAGQIEVVNKLKAVLKQQQGGK